MCQSELRLQAIAESWVEAQDFDLDPNDSWDTKEYGPLTDLGYKGHHPWLDEPLHFILNVLSTVPFSTDEDWMDVWVEDEEGTTGCLQVHRCRAEAVQRGDFIVVHRAILRRGHITAQVPPEGMLAPAPRCLVSILEGDRVLRAIFIRDQC